MSDGEGCDETDGPIEGRDDTVGDRVSDTEGMVEVEGAWERDGACDVEGE